MANYEGRGTAWVNARLCYGILSSQTTTELGLATQMAQSGSEGFSKRMGPWNDRIWVNPANNNQFIQYTTIGTLH